MAPLLFLLLLLPQIEAQRAQVFFRKLGEDAVLPCDFKLSSDTCSTITWGFNAAQGIGGVTVHDGIQSVSRRALSLDKDCSLLINNITEADSGRYFCRMKSTREEARPAVLNVFTLSSSPADTVSDLVIQCALERPFLFSHCMPKRFRWLEKGTGTVVSGDNVQFRDASGRCASSLSLDRGDTKSYTCQYVDGGMQVQIQGDYEPSVTVAAQRATLFFRKLGEDAVLPCDFKLSSDTCSTITWGFNAAQGIGGVTVHDGIQSVSSRALSLDKDCSLLITNITEADSGRYFCRMKSTGEEARPAVLNVFTLSSSPADTVSDLVIQCALERPFLFSHCMPKRFRWLEKGTGTVVSDGDIQFRDASGRCVSSLSLDRGDTKSYTCQYVDGGMQVQIQADYEPSVTAKQRTVLFRKLGEDAVLPCDFKLSSDTCSTITWGFNAAQGIGGVTVHDGIQSVWGRAMSLDKDCSLLINNITEADSGRYFCRMKSTREEATPVILNVFTLSSSPADTVSDLVIQCALERPFLFSHCMPKRFRWLEKGTGTVVSGGYTRFTDTSGRCVSSLSLDRGDTKSYTCQYVDGGMQVQIQADYEPSVTGDESAAAGQS